MKVKEINGFYDSLIIVTLSIISGGAADFGRSLVSGGAGVREGLVSAWGACVGVKACVGLEWGKGHCREGGGVQ